MCAASSRALLVLLFTFAGIARGDLPERAIDVPTRPGVTERILLIEPPDARATVALYAGGNGGLQIRPDATLGWGKGNFLVRSRQFFAEQGLAVALVDAPSDRQEPPYFAGFRQSSEAAADGRALVAWLRGRFNKPVWLIGTSAGTESVGFLATELEEADAPDGVVLTSSILLDKRGRALPQMRLDRIAIPVLVVHHEDDGCVACPFHEVRWMMRQLTSAPRKELIAMHGGESTGDPCEAFAHHGFNGLERDVVSRIAAWITRP